MLQLNELKRFSLKRKLFKQSMEEDIEGDYIQTCDLALHLLQNPDPEKIELEKHLEKATREITRLRSLIDAPRESLIKQLTETTKEIGKLKTHYAQTLSKIPKFLVKERIKDLADANKCPKEVWAETMWEQLEEKTQAEIILEYAAALIQKDINEALKENLQQTKDSALPENKPGKQVSDTEA